MCKIDQTKGKLLGAEALGHTGSPLWCPRVGFYPRITRVPLLSDCFNSQLPTGLHVYRSGHPLHGILSCSELPSLQGPLPGCSMGLPMPSGRDAKGKNPTKEQKQHPHALQKIPWITNYLSWSPSHSDTHAPNSLNPAQTQPKVLKLRHTALVGTRGSAAPPGVLTEQLRCSRFLWAMVAQGNGGGTTPGSAQAAWGTWGWAWWT